MKFRDSYFIWITISLLAAISAQFCINKISLAAAGSGIPQLKAIMRGLSLPNVLTF